MGEPACTPGQTAGPFFHCVLPYPGDNRLAAATHTDAVRLHGTVYDGAGAPVPDALVELWQPGTDGRTVARTGSLRRDRTAFTGWGRCATDADGHYAFTTLPPGAPEPGRAAFFALTVFARGLLDCLFTRAYLPHPDSAAEPLLADLGPERRKTLVCAGEPTGYRFDIRLQGDDETVFLAYHGGRR